MCMRYVVASRPDAFEKEFRGEFSYTFVPWYNAHPGLDLPVITSENPRLLQAMRWGLIPHWSKGLHTSQLNINAFSGEIVKNPLYRLPIRQRRCLVMANCYFVWIRSINTPKVPHVVYLEGHRILSFAGLWDEWISPGKTVGTRSFSIITIPACKRISKYQKTMPAIVSPGNRAKYLDQRRHLNEIMSILHTHDTDRINLYPVSFAINDPYLNDRLVIVPAGQRCFPECEYITRYQLKLEGMGNFRKR